MEGCGKWFDRDVGAVWIWCADGRDTHPELLEGVRLPRGLPEQRDEIHAVALGLEVGHQTRGVLHLLRRGCRGWRGKREGSVIGEVLLGRGIVGGETRSRRRGGVRRGRPGRSPVGSARVTLTALDFPTLARASDEPDILRRVHRCRPRHAQTLKRRSGRPSQILATRYRPSVDRGVDFTARALCLRKGPPPAGSLRSRLERRAVSLWAVPPRSIDETSTMLRVGAQTKNFEADPRPHHEHHRDLISNRTKDVRVNQFKFFVFFHPASTTSRNTRREKKCLFVATNSHPQPRAPRALRTATVASFDASP